VHGVRIILFRCASKIDRGTAAKIDFKRIITKAVNWRTCVLMRFLLTFLAVRMTRCCAIQGLPGVITVADTREKLAGNLHT
jgi:hypothetical protein